MSYELLKARLDYIKEYHETEQRKRLPDQAGHFFHAGIIEGIGRALEEINSLEMGGYGKLEV
jgi:hypothetical protein